MSRALSPSISRRYGLARVARVWNVSRAGIYRFRSDTRSDTIACRPGPVGACSDAELAEHIRRQIILRLSRRRLPQDMGAAALRRRSREPSARATGYGRARLARGASHRSGRGQGA